MYASMQIQHLTVETSHSLNVQFTKKIKIVSPFIHPQVVPNLYKYVRSVELKERYLNECF